VGAEERGRAEDQLTHHRVEGKVLLATGDPQQRVDGHLGHGHADTDHEERYQGDGEGRYRGEEEGATECEDECRDQDRLLAEAIEQDAGRDRHHPVGNEERERQKTRQGETQGKARNDVRHQRAENVGQE